VDNKNNDLKKLQFLGLTQDEAKIYLELLRGPNTHLRLSYVTNINRTKVYRIIDNLEKRSLVSRRTDDRGTFLIAADPATLEVTIVTQEEKIKQQRKVYSQILPDLKSLIHHDKPTFMIQTYEGEEGLRQMFWHELKAKGELLILGGQTAEDLVGNHYWAEKHRALIVEAGFTMREIINIDFNPFPFTENQTYMKRYDYRQLSKEYIYFNEEIAIYNDTVAVYHWRENKKVGVEIISASYADVMRKMFEDLWKVANKGTEIKELKN